MNETTIWNVINKYFEDDPKCLVKHQIDSFNDFFNYNIKQIIKEKNPIKILKQQDEKTKIYKKQAYLYSNEGKIMAMTNIIGKNNIIKSNVLPYTHMLYICSILIF